MIVVALIAVFFTVVATGPAAENWREHRAARRRKETDQPLAKVIYLPSAACRARGFEDEKRIGAVCLDRTRCGDARRHTVSLGEFLVAYEEYLDGKRLYEDVPVLG